MTYRRLRDELKELRDEIAPSAPPRFIAVSDRAEADEVRERVGPDTVIVITGVPRAPDGWVAKCYR